MKNVFSQSLAAVLMAGSTACANMSTLQTARALDPGEGRVLVGGGYYASPDLDSEVSEASESEASLKFPYAEVGYRRGIIENLEAGLKTTVPGTLALDGKYQLLDAGGFALAAGLGAGYLSMTTGEGEDEAKSTIVDVVVPMYASYNLGDYVALYTSPKYLLRTVSGETSGMSHLVGGTGGIKLGNEMGLFFEGTYMRDLSAGFNAVQVNGSFFF